MNRIFIIAEAGVNHNGSLDRALKLVDAACEAGADAVKFQTFRAESLAAKSAPKAGYQKKAAGTGGSQFEMLQSLELGRKDFAAVAGHCRKAGIEFMSTPFDHESLALLLDLGVLRLKVSSGEITNAPLLLNMAGTNLPLIVSTGMCSLGDIEAALGVLAFGLLQGDEKPSRAVFERAYFSSQGQDVLKEKILLLHCTTQYPTPFEDVNLLAMDTLAKAFGLRVGYSDHTPGIAVSIAAAARGAVVLEKHLTLDKDLPGPDHRASLEPGELTAMVKAVREVEKAMGSPLKTPAASERDNREVARRSLVAACPVRKGEVFSARNVAVKRPGGGLTPFAYWDLLGQGADRDYLEDEHLFLPRGIKSVKINR